MGHSAEAVCGALAYSALVALSVFTWFMLITFYGKTMIRSFLESPESISIKVRTYLQDINFVLFCFFLFVGILLLFHLVQRLQQGEIIQDLQRCTPHFLSRYHIAREKKAKRFSATDLRGTLGPLRCGPKARCSGPGRPALRQARQQTAPWPHCHTRWKPSPRLPASVCG